MKNPMASTRLRTKAPSYLSLLTLMLLSATQGVMVYGKGFSGEDGLLFYTPKVNYELKLVSEAKTVVSPELLQHWKELYAIIREEEKSAQNQFRDATNKQFKAGTQLRNAELKKEMIDPVQLTSLQATFDQSVADLKKANLQQKEIKKLIEKARKLNSKPASITEKKVTAIRTTYNDYLARYYPGFPLVAGPAVPEPTPVPPPVPLATQPDPETQNTPTQTESTSQPKPETQTKPKGEEKKPDQVTTESEPSTYDPDMVNKRPGQSKSDQYLSQPFQCIFEIDTFDRATNTSRKALKPGVLFTHTDPDLKPFFRGKDLITCLARISKSGDYVQMTIEFQIASSHSQNNFGALEEGSLLRFKLMNDEYISLFNLKTNAGHIDPYSGYTIFVGQYALGKEEINKLSNQELDKMRVMWSTGFEDYDIYHVDFLINQLNCVKSK